MGVTDGRDYLSLAGWCQVIGVEVTMPSASASAATDPIKEALEDAYKDWCSEYGYLLDAGLPGDLFELQLRLSEAFAKFRSASSVIPDAF